MAKRQERYALIGYFEKAEKMIYGNVKVINKGKASWEADSLIESYGMVESKALVDRFFKVSSDRNWSKFVYNAHKLYTDKVSEQEDLAHRELIKKKMKEWIK